MHKNQSKKQGLLIQALVTMIEYFLKGHDFFYVAGGSNSIRHCCVIPLYRIKIAAGSFDEVKPLQGLGTSSFLYII